MTDLPNEVAAFVPRSFCFNDSRGHCVARWNSRSSTRGSHCEPTGTPEL